MPTNNPPILHELVKAAVANAPEEDVLLDWLLDNDDPRATLLRKGRALRDLPSTTTASYPFMGMYKRQRFLPVVYQTTLHHRGKLHPDYFEPEMRLWGERAGRGCRTKNARGCVARLLTAHVYGLTRDVGQTCPVTPYDAVLYRHLLYLAAYLPADHDYANRVLRTVYPFLHHYKLFKLCKSNRTHAWVGLLEQTDTGDRKSHKVVERTLDAVQYLTHDHEVWQAAQEAHRNHVAYPPLRPGYLRLLRYTGETYTPCATVEDFQYVCESYAQHLASCTYCNTKRWKPVYCLTSTGAVVDVCIACAQGKLTMSQQYRRVCYRGPKEFAAT